MASGQELTAPQIPHRGTAEGGRREVRPHIHPDCANGARPKHGVLARREYGLLALEEPAGDPAATKPQGSKDSPKETLETGSTDGRETRKWERNSQSALFAWGQPEDEAEERGPPERQHTLNMCCHQGGEGGYPPTQLSC